MTLGIMLLDMLELGRLAKGRMVPVQVAHPPVEIWVTRANVTDVAFEMLDVYRIEADDCGVEADVGFGGCWRGEEEGGFGGGEGGFQAVERGKKRGYGFGVGFFCTGGLLAAVKTGMNGDLRGKSRFVYAIVDIVVHPLIHLLNFLPQVLGEQIELLVFVIQQVVKGIVEHADDLAALIADNLVGLLVVERGNCEAAFIVGVLRKVDIAEVGVVGVNGIGGYVLARNVLIGCGEAPALQMLAVCSFISPRLVRGTKRGPKSTRMERGKHTFLRQVPMHASNVDKILQPLQLPHNQRTMRPRTRIGDV
jgi:hypothetical protein